MDYKSFKEYKLIESIYGNNGTCILFVYDISAKEVQLDFLDDKKRTVHVLTKISDSFVPCFDSIDIEGNEIVINKRIWRPYEPSSQQCSKETEKITHTF